MLNLTETLHIGKRYGKQRDFSSKTFFSCLGVVVLLDFLRSQVSEINLLQLIPGLYLFLLFVSLIYLLFFSDSAFHYSTRAEKKREIGTKTTKRASTILVLKSIFSFLFLVLGGFAVTVFPISLDAFDGYGDETLENVWSFDEVIGLEVILMQITIALSQLPVFVNAVLTNEKDQNNLPKVWKQVSFFSVLLAGLVTPTIDGYTQLSFAGWSIGLYLNLLNIVGKRTNNGFSEILVKN